MTKSKSIWDIYYDSIMIKQEPRCENENDSEMNYEHQPIVEIKQEYIYKEELNLDWDEGYKSNTVDAALINTEKTEAAIEEIVPLVEKQARYKPKTLSKNDTVKRIECSKCGKTYKNKNSYRVHSYHCNGKNPPLRKACSKCGKVLNSYDTHRLHMYRCGIQPHFNCNDCNYKTNFKKRLETHIIAKHTPVEKVECDCCRRKYKNENSLIGHKSLCKKIFLKCDNCPYWCKYKRQLQAHIVRTHLKNRNNISTECQHCNRKFQSQAALNGHLNYCKEHDGLPCDKCNYKAIHKRDLQNHIKLTHSVLVVCPKCGELKSEKTFRKHVLYFCERKPRFECDYCHHLCREKSDLRRHILRNHIPKS